MNKKTIRNKLIAIMLVFVGMTTCLSNVNASAYDDTKANERNTAHWEYNVGGTEVRFSSTVAFGMASGTTAALYYDPYLTAKVSGDYYAVDPSTTEYYPLHSSNEAVSSAVISFLAPEGYMTDCIRCDHCAKRGTAEKSDNTCASYL